MSLAVLRSRALAGLNAPEVAVEVHLANGLPSFTLVGLPETEVKEARDRVRAAIQNSGFEFPAQAHHRQPCPGRPAQGIRPLRPADRARHPGRLRADPGADARRTRVRRRTFALGRTAPGARHAGDVLVGRPVPGARSCCRRLPPTKRRWSARRRSCRRAACWMSARIWPAAAPLAPHRSCRPASADFLPDLAEVKGQAAGRSARWKSPRPASIPC